MQYSKNKLKNQASKYYFLAFTNIKIIKMNDLTTI